MGVHMCLARLCCILALGTASHHAGIRGWDERLWKYLCVVHTFQFGPERLDGGFYRMKSITSRHLCLQNVLFHTSIFTFSKMINIATERSPNTTAKWLLYTRSCLASIGR